MSVVRPSVNVGVVGAAAPENHLAPTRGDLAVAGANATVPAVLRVNGSDRVIVVR